MGIAADLGGISAGRRPAGVGCAGPGRATNGPCDPGDFGCLRLASNRQNKSAIMTSMTDPAAQLRWYRLTPDRFVVGLLVVECLLWLSERFQWSSFNAHKGWTVLLAVAVVGLAFLVVLFWFVAALLFRWRFQFSIRSLLVLTVAVAVPCSWMAVGMRAAKRQKDAVTEIKKLRGEVMYFYVEADGSRAYTNDSQHLGVAWLRRLLGGDFLAETCLVDLTGTKVTDEGVKELQQALPNCNIYLPDDLR